MQNMSSQQSSYPSSEGHQPSSSKGTQPPNESNSKRLFLVLLFVPAVLVCCFFCGPFVAFALVGWNQSHSTIERPSHQPFPSTTQYHHVGEAVQTSKNWLITIVSAKMVSGQEVGLVAEADKTYLQLDVTIQNTTSSTNEFAYIATLNDENQMVYYENTPNQMPTINNTTVSGNGTHSGYMLFQVEPSKSTFTLDITFVDGSKGVFWDIDVYKAKYEK